MSDAESEAVNPGESAHAEPGRPAAYQVAVMAMIVTTLAWLPIGALLAIAAWLVFGISPHAFITFGGRFSEPVGMMMWWVVMLLPSSIYAVIASE